VYADLPALMAELRRRGVGVLLCEGGPRLLARLLEIGAVDELFLTLAPQVAGRDADLPRLALVEGTAFTAREAPWWALASVARVEDHLFLRYRLKHREERT
jgi:riboflavin biosynthesis pyrimidine reductase